MALLSLVLVPLAGLLLGLALTRKLPRLLLLVLVSAAHLALTARLWLVPTPAPALGGYLALDPLGLLFLSMVSVVFAAVAVYSVRYRQVTPPEGPSGLFLPCTLLLLAALTLLVLCRHMGMLWVVTSVATLGTTPLINLHRGPHALEATWKYLLLCSVGVAFALLGIFFLGIAMVDPGGTTAPDLFVDKLLRRAGGGHLHVAWLRTAFVFMLVGFGTKIGLAPMHTWKPDTYGEAPTPTAALMATAVCACMFLALLRAYQVMVAAGEARFAGGLLVFMGLVSIGTGAAFVVAQRDYARLLAYSGVEHMGIVALGVGIGGVAAYGALLHLVGHTLVKGSLFMAAGNVRLSYGTRAIGEVRGALRRTPATGALLFAGTFGALGFPPFAMFLSELTILRGTLAAGQYVVAALYLLLLGIVFVAVMSLVQEMVQGADPRGADAAPERESLLLTLPALALLLLAVALGLHVPAGLQAGLEQAAKLIGG